MQSHNRRAMIGITSCLALAFATASASQAESDSTAPNEYVVFDFEGESMPDGIEGSNTKLSLVDDAHGQALKAVLEAKANPYTSITFTPSAPLDLSRHDVAGIAMDIRHTGETSVQLHIDVIDGKGQVHTRSTIIPAGDDGTYFAELVGPDLTNETGLRDTPQDWLIDGTEFTWMWGAKQLDPSAIAAFKLVTMSLASDREIIIDNVRVIADPPRNSDYLVGIVDRFGQLANADFPEKISDEDDIKLRAVEEIDGFSEKAMAGRSRWQGWKDGPRLEGTGYFRTAKVGGKWSLVDPDGYLYFATGIANIRMANTSTMTGMNFRPGFVDRRDPNDTTPEDSAGLNRVADAALPGRYLESALRAEMFTWLPAYDSDLGDHYGYRRDVHSGALKSGETYSFYRANLERKYGDRSGASYVNDWRQITKARMVDWGFTSYGNWLDPSFYEDPKIPFFANGWIIGDFKTVSTGEDYWAPLPDPFDPKFAERARATARQVADEVKGSPWCVGVFIDNEKSWGRPESVEQRFAIVIDTMKRDAADVPTKAVWMRMLREKHGTIDALNAAWGTEVKSWEVLAKGIELTDHNEGKQADYSAMLEAFATEYFRIVDEALNEVMPNHMYLGARFATWGMTPEVINAAKKYVDVVSYNEYKEVPHSAAWAFLDEVDMPSIIGEFHMGAADAGLFHPGLVIADGQHDRARMYTQYMDTVIANPNFVGAHWFQYIDSPLTGRAYDGENYNVGFVTVGDVPYQPMVGAAQEMNRTLYEDRFGDPGALKARTGAGTGAGVSGAGD